MTSAPGTPPEHRDGDGEAGRRDARDDHQLAYDLAAETGELLIDLRARLIEEGTSSWELESLGDQMAHELIMERLGRARPGDAVLSEEGADNKARLQAERV